MGKMKDLYIQYIQETFKDDITVEEYLNRRANSDQEQWEAWRKEQEEKKEHIMIRDFIHQFVDPPDIPEFWEKILQHDATAKISSLYRKKSLFRIMSETADNKKKKQ